MATDENNHERGARRLDRLVRGARARAQRRPGLGRRHPDRVLEAVFRAPPRAQARAVAGRARRDIVTPWSPTSAPPRPAPKAPARAAAGARGARFANQKNRRAQNDPGRRPSELASAAQRTMATDESATTRLRDREAAGLDRPGCPTRSGPPPGLARAATRPGREAPLRIKKIAADAARRRAPIWGGGRSTRRRELHGRCCPTSSRPRPRTATGENNHANASRLWHRPARPRRRPRCVRKRSRAPIDDDDGAAPASHD